MAWILRHPAKMQALCCLNQLKTPTIIRAAPQKVRQKMICTQNPRYISKTLTFGGQYHS